MTVSYNSQMNIQKHVTMRTYDMVNEIKYINNCSDRFLGTFYAINDKIVQNSKPLFAALVEWRWYSFFLSVVAFFSISTIFFLYIHIIIFYRTFIFIWSVGMESTDGLRTSLISASQPIRLCCVCQRFVQEVRFVGAVDLQ